MIPSVNVQLAKGQFGGSAATNDNVTGVVLTGSGTGLLPLLTPVKVVSLEDAESKGITVDAEPEAHQFVREFYSIDGTRGCPVYLMLAAAATSLTALCDVSAATGLKKLIDFGGGDIRIAAVARTPVAGYTPTASKFIDSDVIAAVPNAKAFAQAMFAAHKPLRILLAARVNDVTSSMIDSPNELTADNVGLVIGGTEANGVTSLGLVLGRIAATAPHVNIGRVKDGDLPISNYFIGMQSILPDLDNPSQAYFRQLDQLIDAGYITVKKYDQKGGLFIGNDPMACPETDDYNSLAYGRVIDKAAIVAYQTYVNEINDDIDLDDNGQIEPVVLKALEASMVNALNLNMAESMSGDPVVYIDDTQQLTQTSTLQVEIGIRRKGYSKLINIKLGFNNPQNNN
ncbi:DUF2586 family protein [Mucilaginibacter sp. cycad4]|uniref:DUF2586 family protein n=1 Tax=Mucilaginibacter sp. cycad4 TaxID=3342096 RepID=UPI002AAB2BCA|nr:DUF2586 family protein [Mucilaginibacter gossypii]WPU98385.1 DUF2586 family protein [Mucilaginibacter gossypii]